jgi:hypothetical protein
LLNWNLWISDFLQKLDATQKMLGKTELAKAKLEQLCRELSKQQREEKEQNQLRLFIGIQW